MKRFLKQLDNGVYHLERGLIVGALIVMVLVVFVQVVLRLCMELTEYVNTLAQTVLWAKTLAGYLEKLPRGLPWAEELARYLMIWAGFMGASIATRQRRHIKVDVLARLLPPESRAKAFVMRLASLISAVFCFFMVKVGYDFVANSFQFGRVSSSMKIPMWLVQAIIPVTVFVIACRFLGQAFGEIKAEADIDQFLERQEE